MGRGGAERDGWCILRTSGGRTLALARSLADVGLEVWTPIETVRRRKSRSQVVVEFEAPMIATFVFARARHAAELLRIRQMLGSPHPPFSIFRATQGIPVIADSEIAGLRALEERSRERAERAKAKAAPPTFQRGERVKVAAEAAWAGLIGIVEGTQGKNALVRFGAGRCVKIATYLLASDLIQDAQPGGTGTAALAA